MANTTKTVMSFKIDKVVRDKARKAAARIGLPLSTIVNQQLRQFTESPVVVFGEGTPKPRVVRQVLTDVADMKAGKNVSKRYKKLKDALASLKT